MRAMPSSRPRALERIAQGLSRSRGPLAHLVTALHAILLWWCPDWICKTLASFVCLVSPILGLPQNKVPLKAPLEVRLTFCTEEWLSSSCATTRCSRKLWRVAPITWPNLHRKLVTDHIWIPLIRPHCLSSTPAVIAPGAVIQFGLERSKSCQH